MTHFVRTQCLVGDPARGFPTPPMRQLALATYNGVTARYLKARGSRAPVVSPEALRSFVRRRDAGALLLPRGLSQLR